MSEYKEFFDEVDDVLLQLKMDSDEMIQIIRNLIIKTKSIKSTE